MVKQNPKLQEKSGIVLGYLTIVINFAIGMLYTPFMVKTLGQSEYGLFLQIGALIGYMSVADFGMHSTITRYVAKYRAEKNETEQKEFLGNCLWFYIAVTFILAIIGVFLCANISLFLNENTSAELYDKARLMSYFLLISLVSSLPLGMYESTLNGYGQFFITKGIKLLGLIIRTLLLVLILTMSYGAVGIAFIDMCYTIAVPLVYAVILKVKFGVSIKLVKFNFVKIKEIANYSVYIFILALVNQLYWKIGQVVLGKMISSESSAVYGLATQLINYITPITMTISSVFLPRITKYVIRDENKTEKNQRLLSLVGKYQFLLICLVFVGFISFGKPFITLWVGTEYSITFFVTCILIAAIIPQCILTIGTSLLKAMNLHKYQAIIYGISAIVNVIVGILLSYIYGEVGMAIGTFIAIALVQTPMMVYVLHKKAELDMFEFFKNLLRSSLPTVILSFLFIFGLSRILTIDNWRSFFLSVGLSCAIYAVIAYALALDKNEKATIVRKLSKAPNEKNN